MRPVRRQHATALLTACLLGFSSAPAPAAGPAVTDACGDDTPATAQLDICWLDVAADVEDGQLTGIVLELAVDGRFEDRTAADHWEVTVEFGGCRWTTTTYNELFSDGLEGLTTSLSRECAGRVLSVYPLGGVGTADGVLRVPLSTVTIETLFGSIDLGDEITGIRGRSGLGRTTATGLSVLQPWDETEQGTVTLTG